jgi:AraC-like DNA-binding protein
VSYTSVRRYHTSQRATLFKSTQLSATTGYTRTPCTERSAHPQPTPVSTILTPLERVRVDVVSDGAFQALHRSSVDEIVQDLRTHRSNAVLLSVSQYDLVNSAHMAAMVREFPRVPAYALLTEERRSNPHSVLSLGQLGVRTLIDARYPSGWKKLRELLMNEQANDIQQIALSTLQHDLRGVAPDCWRFFEILLTYYPHIASVRQLSRRIRVVPATLLSRFYRMKLPSPKQYIDFIRLIRAARLLENSGLSVSAVARQLEYSSPQAFSRHTKAVLNLTPVQFRKTYTGESLFQRFRNELILPYIDLLERFHPITADPAWLAQSRASARTTSSQESPSRSSTQ